MEMTFQTIILTIAVIGLIVMLVIIGVSLAKSTSTGIVWPPIIGSCPDYWVDLKGDGAACQNVKNLGTCPNQKTMDFTGYSTCNKYQWSNACHVTWDGITYGVKNPCDTSSEEPPPT
jgi:hypothetical protein